MTLYEAIMKAKTGETISSEDCLTLRQTPRTILFWLFSDENTDKEKLKNYKKFSDATDWKIDEARK